MTIGELIKRKPKKGCLFGVEIEMEGLGLTIRVAGFDIVKEGSLRPVEGEQGKEYVFKKPYSFDDSMAYLNLLADQCEGAELVQFSNRTSVHVHVNVSDLSAEQWFTFLFLWILFEEPLIAFCGEERKGNLFCLSSYEAETLLFTLERCAREGHLRYLNDDVRYSAVNTAATNKYGSLEFRCMRGTLDINVLSTWLSTLARLREMAIEFDTPAALIEAALNDNGFINNIFDDAHFIHNYPDLRRVVMENVFRCAIIIDNCDFAAFSFRPEPDFDI